MGKLLKSSGLIPDDPDNKEILKILKENAEIFFRAGGTLTLRDWSELNNSERMAFVIARELERMAVIEHRILEEAVDKAVHSINGRTVGNE